MEMYNDAKDDEDGSPHSDPIETPQNVDEEEVKDLANLNIFNIQRVFDVNRVDTTTTTTTDGTTTVVAGRTVQEAAIMSKACAGGPPVTTTTTTPEPCLVNSQVKPPATGPRIKWRRAAQARLKGPNPENRDKLAKIDLACGESLSSHSDLNPPEKLKGNHLARGKIIQRPIHQAQVHATSETYAHRAQTSETLEAARLSDANRSCVPVVGLATAVTVSEGPQIACGAIGVKGTQAMGTGSAYRPPRYVAPRHDQDDHKDLQKDNKLTGKKAKRALRREKLKNKKRKIEKTIEDIVTEKNHECDELEMEAADEWPSIDGSVQATDELGPGNPLSKEPWNIHQEADIEEDANLKLLRHLYVPPLPDQGRADLEELEKKNSIASRCQMEDETVQAFQSTEDWHGHWNKEWSEDGYYPFGLYDAIIHEDLKGEVRECTRDKKDRVKLEDRGDPNDQELEDMYKYFRRTFRAYPSLLEDYDYNGKHDDYDCSVNEEDPRPINFLDAEDMSEILNVSNEELEFLEEEFEAALDSGAGDHVASKASIPCYKVQESRGSRMGQKFIGAGGHRMANQGQVTLALRADNGRKGKDIKTTVQVVDVTRPLLSVSKICDSGMKVTFDDKLAIIYDQKGKEVCRFVRQKGLYIAKMKLRNPAFNRPKPFTRPAAK